MIKSCENCIHSEVCYFCSGILRSLDSYGMIDIIVPGPHPIYKETKEIVGKYCKHYKENNDTNNSDNSV